MIQMLNTYFQTYFQPLRNDERGQGLVEYALIIALVAVALIGALELLAGGVDEAFEDITDKLGKKD